MLKSSVQIVVLSTERFGAGIALCAGDKNGKDQKAFYEALIKTADELFDKHLLWVKAEAEREKKAATKKGSTRKKKS